METPEEFTQSMEDWEYLCSTFVGRFITNQLRKRDGLPPLRIADVRERERRRSAHTREG